VSRVRYRKMKTPRRYTQARTYTHTHTHTYAADVCEIASVAATEEPPYRAQFTQHLHLQQMHCKQRHSHACACYTHLQRVHAPTFAAEQPRQLLPRLLIQCQRTLYQGTSTLLSLATLFPATVLLGQTMTSSVNNSVAFCRLCWGGLGGVG
jgi:hypothetical protein